MIVECQHSSHDDDVKTKLLTLNRCSSVFEIVSAFAMIGIILTLVSNFFIQTKSSDLSPCPMMNVKKKKLC